MSIKLLQNKASATVDIKVLVQFAQPGGAVYQGEFDGEFKRVSQEQIDEYMDSEAAWAVSEVVRELLVGASGIGDDAGNELSKEDGLTWVLAQPECVSAAYAAFLKAMRPERYNEKTSKKSRGTGRR